MEEFSKMDYYYSYNCSQSDRSDQSLTDKMLSKKKKKKSTKGGKIGGAAASATQVKLSTDPQSVAARERRHRISERFKILQTLVPGGAKLDTVTMLDEAIHYVKFLKTQIWLHESLISSTGSVSVSVSADDTYYKQFQQYQSHDLEEFCRRPQSIEWNQCSVDDCAAFAACQSSWGYDNDMAEPQFGYETTLF